MECPLCLSTETRVYATWPEFGVIRCTACGFRFIDTKSPEYPENAQSVYNEPDIGIIDFTLPHIQRRVCDILRYKQPPGKVLDIGCGKGEVALALSEKGFECTGIDMKPDVISYLQANFPQVIWNKATANELATFPERYDVLTLYHVLEHITDFRSVLDTVKSLANSGALIVIEVPNAGGWKAKLLGPRWDYYKVDHVNYFRTMDLHLLADELELEVLAIKGYQHFSYPQNVLWKDIIKGVMGWLGFKDVISIFLRAP